MKWNDKKHLQPCAKCPYRKDAPLRLWHPDEFRKLLQQDADDFNGAIYGCHNDGKKPQEERRPCVGWLLDQRRRGTPSIQLRMALTFNESAKEMYKRVHAKGLKLYRSIAAMCRANGVRVSRRGSSR